jgi:hypothetical protein
MKRCGNCGGDIGHSNSVLACNCPPGLCSPCDESSAPVSPPGFTVTQFSSPAALQAWVEAHRGTKPPSRPTGGAAESRREFSWLYRTRG